MLLYVGQDHPISGNCDATYVFLFIAYLINNISNDRFSDLPLLFSSIYVFATCIIYPRLGKKRPTRRQGTK